MTFYCFNNSSRSDVFWSILTRVREWAEFFHSGLRTNRQHIYQFPYYASIFQIGLNHTKLLNNPIESVKIGTLAYRAYTILTSVAQIFVVDLNLFLNCDKIL